MTLRDTPSVVKLIMISSLALTMAGCVGMSRFGGKPTSPPAPEGPAVIEQTLPPLDGQNPASNGTAGDAGNGVSPSPAPSGTFRVALLLPLSATGATGNAAQSLKNAADMAMAEFSGASIDLIVKDDRGTLDGAREAAKQAVAEGASAVLGPLLAPSVQAAAPIIRAAGKPMIAFSTDAGVAAKGTYLLSFMPQSDVERILDFASARGKKSIAALIPDTAYGSVINATLQDAAARRGVKVLAIERYSDATIGAAAKRIATLNGQIDALFIPENGDGAVAAGKALAAAGIDSRKVQLIGTSAWDDPRLFAVAQFRNGWYAMPDKTGFNAFAARYRTRYGSDPVRIASLAYDAVFLANALHGKFGDDAFAERNLTAPDGVIGIDGLFRFRPEGVSQRGLVIMQVGAGSATRFDGAPASFQ